MTTQATEDARERALKMHEVYDGPDKPSARKVGEQFGLSGAHVLAQFHSFGLPVRDKMGGRKSATARKPRNAPPVVSERDATTLALQGAVDALDAEIKRLAEAKAEIEALLP